MAVESALELRMLGPLSLLSGGRVLPLPASRKARALLAYLALAPRPVSRSQLCELLWDAPHDPRGELRWCLSKLRGLLDDGGRKRVCAEGDHVRLDLAGCHVDATALARAAEAGVDALAADDQRRLCSLVAGDLLEGLEIERSPLFSAWLTAQRRRFRSCHTALLERLATSAGDEQALGYLQKWIELAPFDRRAHELLLAVLARQGRIPEGEEHLAAAARLYESEGLDCAPIRAAWRAARDGAARASIARQERAAEAPAAPARRASIAVMPFADHSALARERGGPADALAYDVITRLAKLRSMFVIAQGTVFALHARRIGAEEAGRMLNVDYVVSGSVRAGGGRMTVAVELAETRTARVVWSEVFNRVANDDAFSMLEEIGNRIVASIASEVEMMERNRAILRPPNCLDAWEAHHRGLWHMYRFSRRDNEQARELFRMAIRLDPTFSRPYAGLSFTHWQDAFQGWGSSAPDIDLAYDAAARGLMADDRDPGAHWAMGRALWLRGRHAECLAEFERAVDLSPNFALGHYNLAFVHSTAGDAGAAIAFADSSRDLSPFDPMLFGMLGARAMALARLGRTEEAATWAARAAARPNAFTHIQAIAAYTAALAGSMEEARAYASKVRLARPDYRIEDFLAAFKFDEHGAALYRTAARRLGMG